MTDRAFIDFDRIRPLLFFEPDFLIIQKSHSREDVHTAPDTVLIDVKSLFRDQIVIEHLSHRPS